MNVDPKLGAAVVIVVVGIAGFVGFKMFAPKPPAPKPANLDQLIRQHDPKYGQTNVRYQSSSRQPPWARRPGRPGAPGAPGR